MDSLILGIGSRIRRDDSIGPLLARILSEKLDGQNIDFEETSTTGLFLLDDITQYDRVLIIDSIKTVDGSTGDLYFFDLDRLGEGKEKIDSHNVDLKEVRKMGKRMGEEIPDIKILAVEVEDPYSFSEELSEEMKDFLPQVIEEAVKIVREDFLAF